MFALTTLVIVAVTVTAVSIALAKLEDVLAARDRRRRVDDVFTAVHRQPRTAPARATRTAARSRARTRGAAVRPS